MNEKARELSEEFLPCADQRSIEENLMRVQDRYGWEEHKTEESLVYENAEATWTEKPQDSGQPHEFSISSPEKNLSIGSKYKVVINGNEFITEECEESYIPDRTVLMAADPSGSFALIQGNEGGILVHIYSAGINMGEEIPEPFSIAIYELEEQTIIHRPAAKYQNAVVITKTSTTYSCTHAYTDFLSLAAAGIPVIVDDQANKKIQTATSIIYSAADSIQIKTADLDITFKSDDSIITTPTQTENETGD